MDDDKFENIVKRLKFLLERELNKGRKGSTSFITDLLLYIEYSEKRLRRLEVMADGRPPLI